MARRPSKGELQAAKSELSAIHELATESGNWSADSARYHAYSASRYLETLNQAGEALPDWALRNQKFLEAQGWRFPYVPRAGGRWL